MKIKIGFTGTHGCGKTTAALELVKELKKRNYNAELITEAARSCPFPINECTTVQSQMWIFTEMIQREQECRADIAVCDRTILDVVAYTERISPKQANSMRKFVEDYIGTYDLIFYMEPRTGYLTADGMRSDDQTFQMQIKDLIEDELRTMNVATIKGTDKVFLDKTLELLEDETTKD